VLRVKSFQVVILDLSRSFSITVYNVARVHELARIFHHKHTGAENIAVTEEERAVFLQQVCRPYLQSVIDYLSQRMESPTFISSMSVFDPHHIF
jgi:hypothetical protein